MHLIVPFAGVLSEAGRHTAQSLSLPSLEKLLEFAAESDDHQYTVWLLVSLGTQAIFAGRLDEVQIHNRPLSEAEIVAALETPLDRSGPPTVTRVVPSDGARGVRAAPRESGGRRSSRSNRGRSGRAVP